MKVITSQKAKEVQGGSASTKPAEDVTLKAIHVLKANLPHGVTEEMFLGAEEEVGEKHSNFLHGWFVVCGGMSKEMERKAVFKAFPRSTKSCVDALVNKARDVKRYVGRKGRNLKTGSLMPEWCKGLLVALHGGSGASSSSAGGATLPVQADQPMGEKPCLHKAPPAEVEEADEEVMPTQASVIPVALLLFCLCLWLWWHPSKSLLQPRLLA